MVMSAPQPGLSPQLTSVHAGPAPARVAADVQIAGRPATADDRRLRRQTMEKPDGAPADRLGTRPPARSTSSSTSSGSSLRSRLSTPDPSATSGGPTSTAEPGRRPDLPGGSGETTLVGEISHELRNRLTPLLGAVDLLADYREHLPRTGRRALDLLGEESSAFRSLLTELLDLARGEVEGCAPDVETLSVEAVVRAVLHRQAGEQRAVDLLHLVPGAGGLLVRADRCRLAQVLDNLLLNADVHGGGCVAVHIQPAEAAVLIHVDDAGPGVPVADRERILERFARGPRSAGSGVGLALAARWVHRIGGRLVVGDSPAGGARFTLHLPAVRPSLLTGSDGHRPQAPDVDGPLAAAPTSGPQTRPNLRQRRSAFRAAIRALRRTAPGC